VTSPAFEAIQPLALDPPKAPIVRTPLPGEDVPTEPPDTSSSSKVALPSGESPAPSASSRLVRRKEKSHQSTSEPRRFHLTKSSLKISSPYLVSKTPAQRHARDRKKELAVFVEARDVSREQSIRRKQVPSEEAIAPPSDSTQGKLDAYQTPRKRPNATAVERKWRAENWNKHTGFKASTEQRTKSVRHFSHPSQEWDYESPEFAAQLQQIALQETEAQKESSKNHSSRQCLKVKPKPPKPRQPWVERKIHKEDEDDVMAESLSLDGDTDYVFDTYIRTIAQPPGTMEESDTFSDPLQGLGNTNTGILVIEDGEEQELWQTFGEYIDSDPEWNSEEEDENGIQPIISSSAFTDDASSGGLLWQRLSRR